MSTQPTETATPVKKTESQPEESLWVSRLEDLLKVKNFEDLKTELSRLATDLQTEIQNFDIHDHLSPTAKAKLKSLEQNYNEVVKAVSKAQKQFDREFNKTLRVLKSTRLDAEKQLNDIRSKITKHRGTLVKASKNLQKSWKKKAKSVVRKASKQKKKKAKK